MRLSIVHTKTENIIFEKLTTERNISKQLLQDKSLWNVLHFGCMAKYNFDTRFSSITVNHFKYFFATYIWHAVVAIIMYIALYYHPMIIDLPDLAARCYSSNQFDLSAARTQPISAHIYICADTQNQIPISNSTS